MASTSAPQQGNMPPEVIGQIGSLDSTQVAQILRNLPGLLNKVSCHPRVPSSLAVWLASAICELDPVAPTAGAGMTFRSLQTRVIAFGTYIRFDLPLIPACRRHSSFPSWLPLVLMTSFR